MGSTPTSGSIPGREGQGLLFGVFLSFCQSVVLCPHLGTQTRLQHGGRNHGSLHSMSFEHCLQVMLCTSLTRDPQPQTVNKQTNPVSHKNRHKNTPTHSQHPPPKPHLHVPPNRRRPQRRPQYPRIRRRQLHLLPSNPHPPPHPPLPATTTTSVPPTHLLNLTLLPAKLSRPQPPAAPVHLVPVPVSVESKRRARPRRDCCWAGVVGLLAAVVVAVVAEA